MKKRCVLPLIAAVIGIALSGSAFADTVTLTVGPDTKPDENLPRTVFESPGSWMGDSSWQNSTSNKVNWHARYDADGDFLSKLFGAKAATLTIGDVSSISYFTNRGTELTAGRDWWVQIYTRPGSGGFNEKSWYGTRFINNYDEHTNTDWQQHSTDYGMTFQHQNNSNSPSGPEMTMADMRANYGNVLIEMISIQTDSGWNGSDFLMDGLEITLTDGSVGRVNFSHIAGYSVVVPTPSAALGGLMLMGLPLLRRRQA